MEFFDKAKKLASGYPVLTGALGGAAAGSVIPVIGTGIGALTGAIVGLGHKLEKIRRQSDNGDKPDTK